MKNQKLVLVIDTLIKLVVIIALIIAIETKQQISYFTFLRWLVMATFIYFAYKAYDKKQIGLLIYFGIVAVLFNPVHKFWFQKETWHLINYLVAIITLGNLIFDWTQKEKNKEVNKETKKPIMETKTKIIISKEIVINLKLILVSIGITVIAIGIFYFALKPNKLEIGNKIRQEQVLRADSIAKANIADSIAVKNKVKEYQSAVYHELKKNIKGFKLSESDFIKSLQDKAYAHEVYKALKSEVKGFVLSEDDFYDNLKEDFNKKTLDLKSNKLDEEYLKHFFDKYLLPKNKELKYTDWIETVQSNSEYKRALFDKYVLPKNKEAKYDEWNNDVFGCNTFSTEIGLKNEDNKKIIQNKITTLKDLFNYIGGEKAVGGTFEEWITAISHNEEEKYQLYNDISKEMVVNISFKEWNKELFGELMEKEINLEINTEYQHRMTIFKEDIKGKTLLTFYISLIVLIVGRYLYKLLKITGSAIYKLIKAIRKYSKMDLNEK